MPIPLPDLDDRRYDDLVGEIVSLIPRYAPSWTDHNASDPGIMLIELFSWLFEAMMYRQNRVTVESERTFLKLLNGSSRSQGDDLAGLDLKQAKALTVRNIRKQHRAITAEDFESLVLGMTDPDARIARVTCLGGLNLEGENPYEKKTGHVSLILVPFPENAGDRTPRPDSICMDKVRDFLDERRLITTRIHVVAPVYVTVCLQVVVAPRSSESGDSVKNLVAETLRLFFHPVYGGHDGKGWPFGRPVYASEVYQVIEGLGAVDHVDSLVLYKVSDGVLEDPGDSVPLGADCLVDYDHGNPGNIIRMINSDE